MQIAYRLIIALFLVSLVLLAVACPRNAADRPFTIALDGKFSTLDPIGSVTVDANAQRLRTLMFNSLVKKDDKFDYVGDLASEFTVSEDGLSYTFKLRDNVKFHNGNTLTSAHVKYTMNKLFESAGGKGSAFFELDGEKKTPIISAVETPDPKTVIIKIPRADLKNQLIPNLVPVAIIPKGSPVGKGSDADKNPPPGTGAYKFKSFDTSQNIVDLEAFADYFEGAGNIKNIRVKILADSAALQAELLAGQVRYGARGDKPRPRHAKEPRQEPKPETREILGIKYPVSMV